MTGSKEDLQKQRSPVLVTGGAGFIGSHLVEHLVALGLDVTVLDNFATGQTGNLEKISKSIALIRSDVHDLEGGGIVNLRDFRCIFHLAANAYIPPSVENPLYDCEANLMSTLILLEEMRRTSCAARLVNISSAGVYGNPASFPIRETDPTVPISPYGVSKLAAERYAAVYHQAYGVQVCSMRLFSVYGPRQRKQVIYDILCKLRDSPEEIALFGDGSQERDFVYVTDVVHALILAATTAPCQGEVYNVASGHSLSISSLAERLCAKQRVCPRVKFRGELRHGDADKWVVDISKIHQLGFRAQIGFEDALDMIVEWFNGNCR